MTNGEFVKEQMKLMKPSTKVFMEKQLAKNKIRMNREAHGNYGTPIHIVASYNDPIIPMDDIRR